MYDTVLVPQTIQGLNKVIDIKSNSYFAAALTSDGSVYTWGTGLYSGLGTPLVDDIIPRKVPGLHNIVALSCTGNSYHFLALDANKNCYAWGMNLGQLGVYDALANGSNYVLTPTVVATDVIDIMAGFNFSYIVKTDGSLWCSGKSSGGSIWMNLNNTMRSVFTKIEPDSIQGTCKLLSNNLTSTNECGQQNNGIIIINHNGTNPPFQYSLGNGYQSNNVFGGLSSGNYTVSVLNSIGCVNTYTCTIDSFAGGVVNLNVNNASICNGDSTILSVSGANNYFWSSSYGISSTTGNSISANPSLTTNYLVFGNDNNGCGDTAIVNVSVGTKPIISLISDTICPGSTILIEASGATTYTWSPTESLNSTNNPNVYASPTTSTTYTLQSIDGGCVATQTVNVNVHTPPAADFIYSGSDSILVGNSIELTSISINATGIEWTSCNNIMSSNQTIQIYGEYTGTCCIKLKAEKNNCYDSISKCFVVYEPYYITIPNVFSPNGDGKNDFYKMDASGINTFHCEIYNRWGQKLYEWDGINGYWDGKTKNGIAADGTYYYVINYTTPDLLSKTAHGFITLTR